LVLPDLVKGKEVIRRERKNVDKTHRTMSAQKYIAEENGDTDFSNLYVRFPKIWEDYVDVSWARQVFDGRKVLKYQLAATAKAYRVERYFAPNEVTFRLQGLSPLINVDVQVRALVETAGRGPIWDPWAYAKVTTTDGASVTVASVSSECIHGRIVWGSDLLRNGPSQTHAAVAAGKFQIKVREKGKFLTSDLCERDVPVEESEFTVKDIPLSAAFEVTARAVSVFGDFGRWSQPTRFLTLSPVELAVPELGENYAIVKWSRGAKDSDDTEARIEELVIMVDLLPSQRELDVDSQAKKIQVAAQSFGNEVRMYRLKDLMPGRSYSVASRYRNSLGDWTTWSVAKFSTLCPVQMPDVQMVGHNFIHLSWQRADPEEGATFDDMARNVVTWEVRCTVGKTQTTMQLPAKERETKLVNLRPGVDYEMDVRALTAANEWGLWSTPVVVTTLHRLQPRVEFSGETWLKVNWERREKRYLDNITRYHVQVNAVNSPFRVAKYFPADVSSFTFEHLKPGTKFHVVIQAFSDQRWGPWSDPTETSTCTPCVPQLIRRGEDFIQLKWISEYYQRASVDHQDHRYQVRVQRPPTLDAPAEKEENAVAPTLLSVEEVSSNVYRASRLPCFSRVTIQIRCFDYSLQGWCDWGPEYEFRTLPSALVRMQTGETSVEVSWSRCPRIVSAITDTDFDEGIEDPLYPDNPLKYIIRLNTVMSDGRQVEQGKYHFDSTQPTTYTIMELKPDTMYSLQLSYMDQGRTWSPQSTPLIFRTAPALQVWIVDVTEGTCKLQWGRWSVVSDVSSLEERSFKIIVERVMASASDVPLQFSVHDSTIYTVEDLQPSTLYRVQVAAAAKVGAVWGVWSAPTYILTTPPMELDLSHVGEDYATIQWFRGDADSSLVSSLPGARIVTVSSSSKAVRPPPMSADPSLGNDVFTGDTTAVEYHVQLFKMTPPSNSDDPEAVAQREIFFESKLNANQDGVRIPSLTASTSYEAVVCACTTNKQWGCWSPPMAFCTSTATEVRIQEITQDRVRVTWRNSLSDADVWKYQLRIQGHDDDLYKEVELESTVCDYDIKGLGISCCYSVSLRRFLQSDKNWGQWCVPVFIAVRVVPVEVVEVSQDWTLVRWANKAPPDKNIKKMQFLSLLGNGTATVVSLPADVKQHTFSDLEPNTSYTAHQLVIEQSTTYLAPVLPPETQDRKMELERGNVAPFSLPVVATDFGVFLNDGIVFRTHRPLVLTLERIGQNFALLHWEMKGATDDDSGAVVDTLANSRFEVEVSDLDAENDEKRYVKCVGDRIVVRSLKPNSNVRFCVRAIADKSDAVCKWSNVCVTQMLPMIEPLLGAGDGTDTPGIGEDYVMLYWKKSLRNSNIAGMSGVSFEVRLTPLEGENTEERVVETENPRHHFADLQSDTKYRIEVRTVVALSMGTGANEESIKGEWSRPIVCTTLSPMAVAVVDIVEVGANVHWRRKKCTSGSPTWWVGVEKEVLREEISTISSFHLRITHGDTGHIVFDEQFAEQHEQFAACRARMKALSPGNPYCVSVRASTGMLWGAWSDPVLFHTCSPCSVSIMMVGEKFVVAQWKREVTQYAADHITIAAITSWELAFYMLSSDKPVQTVVVDHSKTRNCVGGLNSNTPHTLMVRPIYESGDTGQWSTPSYFVTLSSMKVDVGKVGETFVQVSWERARQETVHAQLRIRHAEAVKELETQLAEMEQLQAAGGAPITAKDLLGSDDTVTTAKAGDSHFLLEQIEQLRKKIAQRQKLAALQATDLDKSTVYPKGEDAKFELLVFGGAADGEEQPFLFRRRMGKGESFCRLEGLTPKTIYEVIVRALFTNQYPMEGIATTNIGDVDEAEGANKMPWGPWSTKTRFATLKPIVAKAKSIGSECIAVEWDTGGIGDDANRGGAQRTAITRFQIHVADNKKGQDKQRPVITLDDSSLKGYVVGSLTPNSVYSVTVRVCYEGDKWGVWSQPVTFITMPKLLAKLQSVAERQMELLVWRDQQSVSDASVVVWKPMFTEHQLSINGLPCAQPFSLEANTSTLLTLDTLAVDTEYTISVKDRVEECWQEYRPVLKAETVPFPPHRPTLLERKGINVVITWAHRQNLPRQYLYMVEMAVEDDIGKKQMSNNALKRSNLLAEAEAAPRHGNFELLGYTTAQEFRMELHYQVHKCFFRVKCCKTVQTTDGEPLPLTVNAATPQTIIVEDPLRYVWSRASHTAHFKTPSVPDHPTGLHVTDLTHCSATLRWAKPQNHADHSGLKYRVYLNNSYQEKFTCICETTGTVCELKDLVTNCHYRVSVTAESTMGVSQNNNTLHFSTRLQPSSAPNKKMDKPLTSTLPPRAALQASQEVMDAVKKTKAAGGDAFVALLDDTASTVFTAVKMTQQRRSPPRPASGSAGRHRQLPPLDPTNTTV
jgi:hypothetical protein